MNSKEYEIRTSQIAESIFKEIEGIPPQKVLRGSKSKWKGISGFEHQIDVVVCGENDLIMIECKH